MIESFTLRFTCESPKQARELATAWAKAEPNVTDSLIGRPRRVGPWAFTVPGEGRAERDVSHTFYVGGGRVSMSQKVNRSGAVLVLGLILATVFLLLSYLLDISALVVAVVAQGLLVAHYVIDHEDRT
jgi:hypothetical protein